MPVDPTISMSPSAPVLLEGEIPWHAGACRAADGAGAVTRTTSPSGSSTTEASGSGEEQRSITSTADGPCVVGAEATDAAAVSMAAGKASKYAEQHQTKKFHPPWDIKLSALRFETAWTVPCPHPTMSSNRTKQVRNG